MAFAQAAFQSDALFRLPASGKEPSWSSLDLKPRFLLAGNSRAPCDGGSGRRCLSGPIAFSNGILPFSHNAHSSKGLNSASSSFLSNWCPLTGESKPGSRRHGNSRVHARLANQSLEKKQKLAFEPKKASSTFDEIDSVAKEPHKYFDQAVITVKAGDGGHGTLIKKTKKKPAAKGQKARRPKARRGPDGEIQLPMGGGGGDIVLYADPNLETLLEFHRKKKFQGGRGGNVDAMLGLGADLLSGTDAPELRVPVPVGTVVKRKRGGAFLADLSKPGAELRVARGGQGGVSILEAAQQGPGEGDVVASTDKKALLTGVPGEEVKLELTLRVVADLGLVGLPNAGKSSLLKAVSQAKPDIADYPFTTLMPNLGRMAGDPLAPDGGADFGATMADLPGLIEGAHMGRGLGRMFLRHLRRTRLLVHVVDASNPDPLQDFLILREELRMYNPDYLKRPYIIVLNKIDRPEAAPQWEAVRDRLLAGEYLPSEKAPEFAETSTESRGPGSAGVVGSSADVSSGELSADGDSGVSERAERAERVERADDDVTASARTSEEITTAEAATSGGANDGDSPGGSIEAETLSDWDSAVQKAKEEAGWGKSKKGGSGGRKQGTAEEEEERNGAPKAVLGISAKEGTGISAFLKAVREALKEDENSPVLQSERRRERSRYVKSPSWTL
ncbi:GTP-binding protein Obg/CgtA [Klebsormidium nitens]|uniref:GTP-binding protein Obg/CgtA n=1 Tax=Klebsormidium nitens TaxID=105231 RepID=A0A1Y1I5K1_KLENI|nr:GTP-binding protein Obg/CgtA [Klebsormidium nitens]|eukprot:GAQ85232.1 GTP-binding protein Obg/CgtA [Klebsormidium nitens]